MKKTLAISLILAAALLGYLGNNMLGSAKVVYLPKPVVTDTTKLKAEYPAGLWNQIFYEVNKHADAMQSSADAGVRKAHKDSLTNAVLMIVKSVNDSTLNPILKK